MQYCDVLIVGGGPAGSTLAWALRDSGLEVLIMDKQDFPRDKVCAGWITPAVVDELQLDLKDYQQGRVLQEIHGFRVRRLGDREVETRYAGEPVSYGIRRFEFDAYLLQRVAAKRLLETRFRDMRHADGGGWIVNGTIHAALVVGAGGHFCPVARQIGARPGKAEIAIAAQEIEFRMSPAQQRQCPIQAEIPELFFCEDLKGYGWVVRKQDYLNIGLGREDSHQLGAQVQAFSAWLKKQGRIPEDTPDKFHGHAYLLYPHAIRRVYEQELLIIGDAAGLAYPQSGEGIRPAVESALLAAQVIRVADRDYSAAQMARYQELLTAQFGDRSPAVEWSSYLPGWLRQMLASKLLANHWFVRHVVMDRWFLHSRQAPLMPGC